MGFSGLFETVYDIEADRDKVIRRRYGVIEVVDQRFKAIRFRPYPKMVSVSEIRWSSVWKKDADAESLDRVLLYFDQPMRQPNFLALKFFVSEYKSTLASIAVSLSVLDWVAMTKKTDAIVSEISNKRIKDRHLAHFGWENHLPKSKKRHWIKRFYGDYPESFLFQTIGQTEPADQQPSASPTGKLPVGRFPRIAVETTNRSGNIV